MPVLERVTLWRCPRCGHASETIRRCKGPRLWRHPVTDCERVEYVPATDGRGAVDLLREARDAIHALCLERGSTDGYADLMSRLSARLPSTTSGGQ